MAAHSPIAAPEETAVTQPPRPVGSRPYGTLRDYWELTKPEIDFLILIATFAGFYLGSPPQLHGFPFARLVRTLLGTLLVAGGTGTLNQYVERRFDARMRRTARRPLAAGRIAPAAALWFGVLLSVAGALYLAVAVNALASLLAVLTLVCYLAVYTPLKRKTPLCTMAGALPGAMPPLIGWAASAGSLSFEAWVLYAMLFLWQFPHFMAIAWMYREDYARAGYMVLPGGKRGGRFMSWQALVPSLALIPVVLSPTINGYAGFAYFVGACLLSSEFFCFAARLAFRKSNLAARQLLMASIVYLPLAFGLMMLGKGRPSARATAMLNHCPRRNPKISSAGSFPNSAPDSSPAPRTTTRPASPLTPSPAPASATARSGPRSSRSR